MRIAAGSFFKKINFDRKGSVPFQSVFFVFLRIITIFAENFNI